MKNLIHIFLLVAFVTACAPSEEQKGPGVNHIGELRQIMHQGKYQSRIAVDTIEKTNLYAVGALENLSGEITIVDGEVFVSKVINDSIRSVNTSNLQATLLVTSRVSRWDTLSATSSDLEETVAAFASKQRRKAPFPFLVTGKPDAVIYHIINFDTENGDLSNHKAGAKYDTLTSKEVTLVGFYATDAKGVYTHHDSNIHVHVITKDGRKTGHLEKVIFGESSFQLLMPAL